MLATEIPGQRFDALLECIALVGQCNFAALRCDGLGDTIGNGTGCWRHP